MKRTKDTDPKSKAMYEFTIQMAPCTWEEYLLWNSHRQWTNRFTRPITKGLRKKSVQKKEPMDRYMQWFAFPSITMPV